MKVQELPIKIHKKPRLNQPYLVAAGPGTGNVGLMTVEYLKDKLGAELLAEIGPGDFFSVLSTFVIQDGVAGLSPVSAGDNPAENKLYFWKGGGAHDLLFFLGNTHPLPGKGRQFAEIVLDLAGKFGAKTLFIPGAFVTDTYHKKEPRVFGMVNKRELLPHLKDWQVEPVPSINVAYNMNTWLLSAAVERNLDAMGLITEIPFYTAEGPNPRACRALLGIMGDALSLPERVDLGSLDESVSTREIAIDENIEELKKSSDEKSREFIAYLERVEKGGEMVAEAEKDTVPLRSLGLIEKIYTQAKSDPSKVGLLREELDKLDDTDRLEVFRKLGDELLDLFKREN